MIDPNAPTSLRSLNKYRGEVGTIKELCAMDTSNGTTLEEFPGIMVNEIYLIPINNDEDVAFERFMGKLKLNKSAHNPWLHDEV